jgi:hypothetical protein
LVKVEPRTRSTSIRPVFRRAFFAVCRFSSTLCAAIVHELSSVGDPWHFLVIQIPGSVPLTNRSGSGS